MPGTPCVFLPHWNAYKPEIKAMIEARKLAGITNNSNYINFRSNQKYFANMVDNKLLVVVGDEKQVEPRAEQAADQRVVLEQQPQFPRRVPWQKPEARHSVCSVYPCRRFRT